MDQAAGAEPARRVERRGPYAKSAERRRQIVDKVLSVYDELGFEGTSLRAIATSIGVTHPVLVHHFGTREQLFLEVLREHDLRFGAQVQDETLADLLRRSARYSARVPGLTALLGNMVARALESGNERSHAYFVERYARLRRQVGAVLESARAAGTVRSDIPLEATAGLLVAAADGLSTQWLLDREVDMEASLLVLDRLLDPPAQSPE
ncbi:TetR/AcrR family transcriptional regulator [Promicromonospora sp. NPDC050262]|uniref:TetR/AcrR family transcriptional regulator n=1 Tax=Promicromonospora sp. NPDC050262 TaxID=3155036 RepID=UPI0034037F40